MTRRNISRRVFLKDGLAVSACTGWMLAHAGADALANPTPTGEALDLKVTKQDRALVFIMLDGGNDSFNMLVPLSSGAYQDYRTTRGHLAIACESLLPLQDYQDNEGRRFGLHPAMKEVQQLFNTQQLALVANMAPMIEPVTKEGYFNGSAALPLGLLSHADLFKHWQTSRPGERLNQGWFGAIADVLQRNRLSQQVPMNISLAGSNIIQNGRVAGPYAITSTGSVGLEIEKGDSPLNGAILNSFQELLNVDYPHDPFKSDYLTVIRDAQAQHEEFKRATSGTEIKTPFSNTDLSQELKQVARSIKAAGALGMQQQTFFVRYIGWDHHDELLNNHQHMLDVLSKALGEFQQALYELGIAERVITFTGSDFGRTLTSNGNGTDHGWGGNTLVMGEAIDGRRIFGEYPSLVLGAENPLDIGDGVLIPTTATDPFYAELAQWFGVATRSIDRLFPNLKHFHNIKEHDRPLGIV